MEQLADLDELVLRCRSANARRYIGEAVSCYRAGAQRAAIVATWIAVVYDFIDKLRELELGGDPGAKTLVDRIENIRKANDVAGSLAFERTFLDAARDEFELISQQEYADFQRLLEDRNRCAHPSLNAESEAYRPPAELARYHITNAVVHLLQHQPAQGRAALERIFKDVSSPLFPRTRDEALVQLRNGPLGRARESLVRNAILLLLKNLFLEPALDAAHAERLGAAAAAIGDLYRAPWEQTLRDKTPDVCKRAFDEHREQAALDAVRALPALWDFVREDARAHLQRYMVEAVVPPGFVARVFAAPIVKDLAVGRLPGMPALELAEVIRVLGPQPEFIDPALGWYESSLDFDNANTRATNLVVPLAPLLREEHVRRIAKAVAENFQVRHSFRVGVVMNAIKSAQVISDETLSRIIEEYRLEPHFPALVIRPPQGNEPTPNV